MSLRPHPIADQCSECVVADIDRERRPVGVDQRDAAAGAHHPHHLGDRGCGVGEPLERAFGPRGVEGVVGLVEGARVAEGEAHATTCGSGVRTRDAQHLLGRIDADDLTAFAEILGERERCLPEAAAHVEQPFTGREAESCSLPRSQSERRVPSGGAVHRVEEHVDVRILIDPLVAEPVGVLGTHAASVDDAVVAPCSRCHSTSGWRADPARLGLSRGRRWRRAPGTVDRPATRRGAPRLPAFRSGTGLQDPAARLRPSQGRGRGNRRAVPDRCRRSTR